MELPIYYTFKEFEKNYSDDLKKWFDTYPDATEKDFKTESKKKYIEYYHYGDTNLDNILEYIEIPLFKDFDSPFGYLNLSDPISLQEFFKIITHRFNDYFDTTDEISQNEENYRLLINSNFVFDYLDENNFPQPRANIFSDQYFITKKDFDLYLPFAKVEYYVFLKSGDVELDKLKFKNFAFATRRIIGFLNDNSTISSIQNHIQLKDIGHNYYAQNVKINNTDVQKDTDNFINKEFENDQLQTVQKMEIPIYFNFEIFEREYLMDFHTINKYSQITLIDYCNEIAGKYFDILKKIEEITSNDELDNYLGQFHSNENFLYFLDTEYSSNVIKTLARLGINDHILNLDELTIKEIVKDIIYDDKNNIDSRIARITDDISNSLFKEIIRLENHSSALKKVKKQTLSNPKKLALLHAIGIFDLPMIKKLSNDKQNEIIGLLLDANKTEFVYKNQANINTLNSNKPYDITKYTAYTYLDDMSKLLSEMK